MGGFANHNRADAGRRIEGRSRSFITQLYVGESLQPIPMLAPLFESRGADFFTASDIFLVIAIVVVIAMIAFYPRIPDKARASPAMRRGWCAVGRSATRWIALSMAR